MRFTLTAVAIVLTLSLVSCRQEEPMVEEEQAQAPQPHATGMASHTGTVQEVLQANAYTYLQLKEQDDLYWIAITKRDVNVGDTVSFGNALEMTNFVSKDLNRTFDTVYFVSQIDGGSQPSAPAASAMTSPHEGRPVAEKAEISVAPAEGGISIGQLFTNPQSYAGKPVLIRGQVTKVNHAIMGKNWVHLQDGTGDGQHYDLTLTTQDDAAPGEVVTFEGTITLNKDFGSGYAYDVLMEDAVRQKD